jgi:nicotinamidase-related amidase
MAKLARLERHLSAGNTGLILFDALNGYLHPNNPAKVQFLAERNIIGNLKRLLDGARGIGTIVIAGGSTDVGIASTVFAARDLDYGIVVVRDACYSTRGTNNDFFMDRVFPRMGRVMRVDEAVALMTR